MPASASPRGSQGCPPCWQERQMSPPPRSSGATPPPPPPSCPVDCNDNRRESGHVNHAAGREWRGSDSPDEPQDAHAHGGTGSQTHEQVLGCVFLQRQTHGHGHTLSLSPSHTRTRQIAARSPHTPHRGGAGEGRRCNHGAQEAVELKCCKELEGHERTAHNVETGKARGKTEGRARTIPLNRLDTRSWRSPVFCDSFTAHRDR